MQSQYPKIVSTMSDCFRGLAAYIEQVLHPASGKDGAKAKRRAPKSAPVPLQASPDATLLRTSARANNAVRRNPAP